jgi:hypothetical protein
MCYFFIAVSALALFRRAYNWFCWLQIDRICKKYDIPKYNQKELLSAYEGVEVEEDKVYNSYSEAIQQKQHTQSGAEDK